MNTKGWANLIFVTTSILIFGLSVYYITFTFSLNLIGVHFYDSPTKSYYSFNNFIKIQIFFWIFLFLSIFNNILYIYTKRKDKDLSFKGNIVLIPFLIIIIAILSDLYLLNINYSTEILSSDLSYVTDVYPYRDYFYLIMLLDIFLFISTVILINQEFQEFL
ncbi:MAG: hypothetical protein P8Y70_06615 [Candidatus Lokiarchaeota archaeon]